MATEVRHLQRSEVREVEEAFGAGQKGSSAMPHKRNPIGSENVTGCARLLRGYMVAAYENVALWHERDISHSSVERVVIPDATTIMHYALTRFAHIVRGLVVYPEAMQRNMERSLGLHNSQRLLLALIDKGLSREEAYDIIQPCAMQAWKQEKAFKEVVLAAPDVRRHMTPTEVTEAFDVATTFATWMRCSSGRVLRRDAVPKGIIFILPYRQTDNSEVPCTSQDSTICAFSWH